VHVEISQVFDRPPEVVFKFLVIDHIANHPRWDPQMELWPVTEGPLGLGTVIKRRQSRGEVPTEGTMEVVEFDLDRAVGWVVHDGPFTLRSRSTFEPIEGGGTKMTTSVDLPEGVKAFDPSFMERSMRNMKALIEAET
jgi:uncharacterized protein YndB with AHSA1/START domain